jgi:hypothetical protein
VSDQTQKTIPAVEKLIAEQSARLEAALAEIGKLQSKGVAQINEFVEGATRVAHEQLAFAEQLGGEWRKLVLSATRSAADLFAPKA